MNYEERGRLNDELYPLVVAGDQVARQRMIECNMGLVEKKVKQYLKKYPHLEYLREDLISAGCVSLVNTVNRLQSEPRKQHPLAFVATRIRYDINCYAHEELGHGFGISSRTVKNHHSEQKNIPGVRSLTDADSDTFTTPENSSLDILETIYDCCRSKQERKVVELRAERWTDQEIAQLLNIPRATVRVIRKRVEGRYDLAHSA